MIDAKPLEAPELERTPMPVHAFWRDLWARTALQGLLVVAGYFLVWELGERAFAHVLTATDIHAMHLLRGAGAAFLLGTWSFLRIRQARIECDTLVESYMNRLECRVRERTRELEDARAFTELLFDSLRERIIVRDQEGRVVKANRMAEAVADSTERVWEVETIPVPDRDGHVGHVIEVGRDVTEPRNLEAQIRHQEKMASLGVLTAGFAHDLGNPLASLSTELELLEGEEDLPRIHESLGVLRSQVARMSRTLREMVDFARRRRDEVADVSLAAAVTDTARLVKHDPRMKRVALAIDVPPSLPPVRMVEDHLVLVLVNLMLNAADAMPGGGALSVSAAKNDDGLLLHVRDTGAGMTPEVLAKAKSPLFTTKGQNGTGLGLAVCDGIVRATGGSLDITSAPGKGTDVAIRLPKSARGEGVELRG